MLASCGGGGGGSSTPPPLGSGDLSQQCSPNNPYRGDATAPTALGSLSIEKAWLASYMNAAYLWYTEIPAVDPTQAQFSNETTGANFYTSIDNYFNALLTPAITASGKRKDQFSFTYPTKAWQNLSQSGSTLSDGIEWYFSSPTPPRGLKVAYVEPSSPATTAATAVQRGDVLVSVNGVSADDGTQAGVDALNAALFPTTANTSTFVFSRNGSQFTVTLTATNVVKQPVLKYSVIPDTATGTKVGYILFNDHVAPAEGELIDAVNALNAQGPINDLVLDIRYNGGGYLYIASELAYMIAGPGPTTGHNFESLIYSSKRSAENTSTPFYNVSCYLDANFNCTSQTALPTLNLNRVYVLTSSGTCSASEAIINGLRGVGVNVVLIGPQPTCGKPYGFTAKDNCGISYFPIEFQGVNDVGFGSYADGFTPTCTVADDFSHQLGDTAEGQLSGALYYRTNGACPAAIAKQTAPNTGFIPKIPARQGMFLVPLKR